MGNDPHFDALLLLALFWLSLLLYWAWRQAQPTMGPIQSTATSPSRTRSHAPTPFPGLIHKPLCEACERATDPYPKPPSSPPSALTFTRGRKRTIDTQQKFCPDDACSYYGWLGRGNIRANGHPGGKSWRQLPCVACHVYFQETHGTPLHGKRVSPDMLVWAVGALAEELGIRAAARVFEVDSNTVLQWLVEVADHAAACFRYFLHDVQVNQVQLDALLALRSAVKDGEVTEAEAMQRLSRSPHWVWVAMDPESKLILTINVGFGAGPCAYWRGS